MSVEEIDGPIEPTRPGQFFMLRTEDRWPVLLPRPFELDNAWESEYEPLRVLSCSPGNNNNAGWLIQPGETQIVHWVLDLPAWCLDKRYQHYGLPISFECFPYFGVDDLPNQHPIGNPMLVHAELAWPMSEAHRYLDHNEVQRISQLISQSNVPHRSSR